MNELHNKIDPIFLIKIALDISSNKGRLYWKTYCQLLKESIKYNKFQNWIFDTNVKEKDPIDFYLCQLSEKDYPLLIPKTIPLIDKDRNYFESLDKQNLSVIIKLNLTIFF